VTSAATSVDTSTAGPIEAVVFDIGGVLLDWDPRYLYRSLLPDETSIERFLAEVCTPSWNAAQDAGRDWDEAVATLTARFPEHADLIRAYHERWPETVAGVFEDTVAVLRELRAAGVPTYALTNFSAQKWEIAVERWSVLREFDGAVVSGKERVTKPDPAIYRLLLERYGLAPQTTFFTDDSPANVEAARRVGLRAELFVGADALRAQLVAAGVLRPSSAATVEGQAAPHGAGHGGGPAAESLGPAASDGQVGPGRQGSADESVATEVDR
jgi:2-haloacid dehalogenase